MTAIDQWRNFCQENNLNNGEMRAGNAILGYLSLPFELRSRQLEALCAVVKNGSLIYIAPTGAGKTIGAHFIAARAALSRNPQNGDIGVKVIYTSPLRDLTEEHVETFEKAGFQSLRLMGGDRVTEKEVEDAQIIFLTPEKFLSVIHDRNLKTNSMILNESYYMVIDEIHTIGDSERGCYLELAIAGVRTFFPRIRLTGLSGTCSNPELIAKCLGIPNVIGDPADPRPVPLTVNLHPIKSVRERINESPYYMDFQTARAQWDKNANSIINDITSKKDGGFLVICNSRKACISGAKETAAAQGARIKDSLYGTKLIDVLLQHRTAYHNAGLSQKDRKRITDHFRKRDIDSIWATTTLAAGVNLPSRTVIVRGTKIWNSLFGAEILYRPDELGQIIGRAGRPGFDDIGFAEIICDEEDVESIKVLLRTPHIVKSGWKDHEITVLLSLCMLGMIKYNDLERAWSGAIGGDMDLMRLSDIISKAKEIRMLDEIGDEFHLTRLGIVAARRFLLPESVIHIRDIVEKMDGMKSLLSPDNVVAEILQCPEFLSNVRVTGDYFDESLMKPVPSYNEIYDITRKALAIMFLDYYHPANKPAVPPGDRFRLRKQAERFLLASVDLSNRFENSETLTSMAMDMFEKTDKEYE